MNKFDSIEEAKKEYEHQLNMIKKIPDDFEFDRVAVGSIFKYVKDYNEYLANLKPVLRNGYKFRMYYINGQSLSVLYALENAYDYIFSIREPEVALNKLSKGKCKIVEVEEKVLELSCDL